MGNTVKKRTSKRQAEANRANAKKSTGPRTAAGKARVRHNSVTHGLRTEDVVVRGGPTAEDPAEFSYLLGSMLNDCKPKGALERVLVERLAVSYWRLRRAYRFEARAIEQANKPNPMSKMLEELSQLPVNKPGPQELPGLRSLDKLVRYEMMIDRELLRTAAQLQHLQRVRKLEEEDADPEPGPSGSGQSAGPRGSSPQPEGCGSGTHSGPQPEGRCATAVSAVCSDGQPHGSRPTRVGGGATGSLSASVLRPDSCTGRQAAHATRPLRHGRYEDRALQHGRHGRGTRKHRSRAVAHGHPGGHRAKSRQSSVAEQSHLGRSERPARACGWGGSSCERQGDHCGVLARCGGTAMIYRPLA